MATKKEIWVTTVDNPFDPFTQWDRWYSYDMKMGYNTCGRLANLAAISNDLSDAEVNDCIDSAIKTLLDFYEPFEVYRLAIEGKEQQFGLKESNKSLFDTGSSS